MKTLVYTALLLIFVSGSAYALKIPHEKHEGIGCNRCHQTKNAPGPNSTRAATNYEVCSLCHSIDSDADFFAFQDSFKSYTVGLNGAFHKWNVSSDNAQYGASAPQNTAMKFKAQGGQIVCSTCHDQHAGKFTAKAGRLHKSPIKVLNGGASGFFSYSTAVSPDASGYTVEIVAGGTATTATYKVSYNGGLSWMGWNTGTSQWVAYIASPSNARIAGGAVSQNLDNAGNARIRFSGNFTALDKWKFYIGYPFLRTYPDVGNNTVGRRFCRDCHSQRAQTHYAGGNTWNGQVKSHPVGVALNSNGGGYDRKPLDVDGCQQGKSGGNCIDYNKNSTNDLLLFQGITSMTTFGNISSGDVQCMTCHAPHWSDSNSRTRDRR